MPVKRWWRLLHKTGYLWRRPRRDNRKRSEAGLGLARFWLATGARDHILSPSASRAGELLFELALFAGDGRCGEVGDVRGQIERLAKPQLEPQGQIVRSMLQRKCRVARQMGETSLMRGAMLLQYRLILDLTDGVSWPLSLQAAWLSSPA